MATRTATWQLRGNMANRDGDVAKWDRDMTSGTVMWPTWTVTWKLGNGVTTGTVICKLGGDVASEIATWSTGTVI